MRYLITILLSISLLKASCSSYIPFIAENSGTRITRETLNAFASGGKGQREESHRLYFITPFTRDYGLGLYNRQVSKNKEKFLEKHTDPAEISKEFSESKYQPVVHKTWDPGSGVIVLVTPSRNTTKKILNFNFYDKSGNIVCNENFKQLIPLNEDNANYISAIHSPYGLSSSVTKNSQDFLLKNYKHECLMDPRIDKIRVELISDEGKVINISIDIPQKPYFFLYTDFVFAPKTIVNVN